MFSNNRVLLSLLIVSLTTVSVCLGANPAPKHSITIDCSSPNVVISVTNKTDFETSPTQTTVHLGNVNQCGDTGENQRAECVGAADGTWGWKFTLTNNTDCDADVSTNATAVKYVYTVKTMIAPDASAVVHRHKCVSTKVECIFKRAYNLTRNPAIIPESHK